MRKPRVLRDGASYHVTARTNDKVRFLDSDSVKDLFLDVVRRARKKYRFTVENFCIMGNHVHLIIRPGRGQSLSAIMQWILGVFAMAFNRRSGHTNHVWGGRFFSRVIAGLRDLLQAFEYVDENPVSAGQVQDKRDWRYGGLGHSRAGRRDILGEAPDWMKSLFPDRAPPMLEAPALT
jgi:putative transposase